MVLVQGVVVSRLMPHNQTFKHKLSHSYDFGTGTEIDPVTVAQKTTDMRKGKTVTKGGIGHSQPTAEGR